MSTAIWVRRAGAAGIAALLSLTMVVPGNAAPLPAGAVALKGIVRGDVVDVRWRGHGGHGGRGGWVAGGIGAGLALGAIAVARPRYYRAPAYYGPPAYYAPPPAEVYAPAPAYSDPAYGDQVYDDEAPPPVGFSYPSPARERQLLGRD